MGAFWLPTIILPWRLFLRKHLGPAQNGGINWKESAGRKKPGLSFMGLMSDNAACFFLFKKTAPRGFYPWSGNMKQECEPSTRRQITAT
jgi:hypothetical protein